MTLEGSCRCEFTELVTDHILCYINRNVLTSVVNSKSMTNEIRENC